MKFYVDFTFPALTKMKFLMKIVNSFQPLTIFAKKTSILDDAEITKTL